MGAYPQQTFLVGHYAVHRVVGKALAGGEVVECEMLYVAGVPDAVEAAAGRGEPHGAGTVFKNVAYLEIAEVAVVGSIVAVGGRVVLQLVGVEDDNAVATTGKDVP